MKNVFKTNPCCLILFYTLVLISVTNCSLYGDDNPPEAPKKSEKVLRSDFFQAIINNDSDSLDQIIIDGADIDAYDSEGMTGLMVAIELDNVRIARKLIDAGVKIFKPQREDSNTTAFDLLSTSQEYLKNQLDIKASSLYTQVRSKSEEPDYAAATSLITEQYIPMTLGIDDGNQPILSMAAQSPVTMDNGGAEFIIFLMDRPDINQSLVRDAFANLNKLSSQLKNIGFTK
ncbi:MAG: ankyrin repeat domain-containing protein, partial [Bdellovibrionales bacterium]|nr:ankyrin repeat domain-containing protein [Bdellovibrionales bacterium]NQZ18600.1 ankyrin repeat domain-containing protein [Bdellovibrionales bacterium]